jgi:iron(III) transport system permease protein
VSRSRPSALAFGMLAAIFAFLACFLVWPLVESLRGAFFDPTGRPTLAYVTLLAHNPTYVEGFVNAVGVAVATTVLASVIGIAVALVLDRFSFPGKWLLTALVPLPLVVPPFVGAIGIKQLLGQTGALNALLIHLGVMDPAHPVDWLRSGRFWAVVVLTSLHLYPVVYFNVAAALANLSTEMEEAAESLGARPSRTLFRITLPLVMPSLFAAVSVVFIWAFTELGVPLACDYTNITAVQVWAGLKDIGRNPVVYALVAVVLLLTVGVYVVGRVTLGRGTASTATRPGTRRKPRELGPAKSVACAAFLSLIVAAAALPNVGVLLVSVAREWYGTVLPSSFTLAHYQSALGHDLVVPSIGNSLRYVAFSTTLDISLGVGIAYVAVRGRGLAGPLLDAAAMLPLAVPGLVLAFGYLAISREGRPLAWLNPARDPTVLLVVAYAVRRLPFVVRSASAGFQQISTTLEEAAQNLGASARRTFMRVSLPLLGPHLLAGAVFAFALSMLEVSDSLILAQKQATYPITKAVYELFQLLGTGRETAAALGVWAMLFLALAVAFARSVLGRRFGGIFRV